MHSDYWYLIYIHYILIVPTNISSIPGEFNSFFTMMTSISLVESHSTFWLKAITNNTHLHSNTKLSPTIHTYIYTFWHEAFSNNTHLHSDTKLSPTIHTYILTQSYHQQYTPTFFFLIKLLYNISYYSA